MQLSNKEGKLEWPDLVLLAGTGIAAGEATMRLMLIVSAAAAAMLVDLHAGRAYEGPWCALSEIGGGVMQETAACEAWKCAGRR